MFRTVRLGSSDVAQARTLFTLLAEVFDAEPPTLTDEYLRTLLSRPDFYTLAAFRDAEMVGGLTAHVLPMTRSQSSEIFIYDLAIHPRHQRQGAGRELMAHISREAAAIGATVFVAADVDDGHAVKFYGALGGIGAPAVIFGFGD